MTIEKERTKRRKMLLRAWQLQINLERRYGRSVEHITRSPLGQWCLFNRHHDARCGL